MLSIEPVPYWLKMLDSSKVELSHSDDLFVPGCYVCSQASLPRMGAES